LVLAGLAYVLGATHPPTVPLLFFCFVGLGAAPWALNRFLRLPARITLTMLTGLSVLILVATVMLKGRSWHPAIAFLVVSAGCVPLHVMGVRLALHDLSARTADHQPDNAAGVGRTRGGPDRARWPHPPLRAALLGAVGFVLCLVSALLHRHLDPGVGGFLPKIGIFWCVGLALLLVAIALSRSADERSVAIAVLLLLLALTLTPAIVYDGPRSQSAAKHIDLVQQIRTLHRLDTAVEVYNSWPGFFAALAWVCDVAGIRDPLRLATFWPPLLGLFRLAALRYLAGMFLPSAYQCWVAVALAVLADPLGADYFSPQSVGYVVGLGVFGLALARHELALRVTMILAAGVLLALSHQLSPYVVGGVLAVLVVFRLVRPWWMPLLVLVPAGLWTLGNSHALRGFVSLREIGHLQNFLAPKTAGSAGLSRLPIVDETVAALVLGIGIVGLAALVALVRARRDPAVWAQACCPAVGLVLVAVNPYGNEGIFRAALFGVPWLALLAARLFGAPGERLPRLPLVATTTALTMTFLVAAFALDATNVIRLPDLEAHRYFQRQGGNHPRPPYYLLHLGAGDLPGSLPTRFGGHVIIRRDDLDEPVRQERDFQAERQVRRLTAKFVAYAREDPADAHLYAIWSPVSSYYAWMYGIQLPGQFAALRDAFRVSPDWSVAMQRDGTFLFRFEPHRYVRTPR
jgi:hypothetical protein